MRQLYTFILTCFISIAAFSQEQKILLFAETFDGLPHSFLFDSAGPPGAGNFGPNNWIVNNDYDGQQVYPNTKPQDSIFSGTISGAPFSKYLHIYNSAANITNANWDPNNASDKFCYIGNSFCTLGLTNTIFTFFWLCEGDTNSYGEVYYRSGNTNPWKKTGKDKYYGQSVWKYEEIQDTGFNDLPNVQLGFRWVNKATGVSPNISFSIDDVIAVGSFNAADTTPGATQLFTVVFDDTICQRDAVNLFFGMNKPMCDATYRFELSNSKGSFAAPNNLGIITRGPSFLGSNFFTLPTPETLQGDSFRMRVVRTGPPPVVTSDTSDFFSIKVCPNVINNLNSPVMTDGDTTCILSVVDIQFNSTGVYKDGNRYIAELSDTNGFFADSTFLGNLNTKEAYPGTPKGNIGGLIPATVPAGCGYYIRIRSTNPVAVSPRLGPYCLVKCDERTNLSQDLKFCIDATDFPGCDTITIKPNYWDTVATYSSCNNWTIELRSMKDFSLVNRGGLGVYHDSIGGNFTLCMPTSKDKLPVAPGSYYMRIISNCSSQPWNQTGTVIRITIGAPDSLPPNITADGFGPAPAVEICRGSGGGSTTLSLRVSPFNNPPSDYQWSSSFLNNGLAFIWKDNPLNITIPSNAAPGDYVVYVREISFECKGGYSAPFNVKVVGKPDVNISGPKTVCIGDTAKYNVTYFQKTYYSWTADPAVTVLDRANSEATMIFNNLGTYKVYIYSINECDSATGSFTVKVTPPYFDVNAGADKSICNGDSVELTVETSALQKQFLTQDIGELSDKDGGMFNITAHADIVIDSFAIEAVATSNLNYNVEVYAKDGAYRTFERTPEAWTIQTLVSMNGSGFKTISAPIDRFIPANSTAAFYITSSSPNAILKYQAAPGGALQETVFKTDGVMDFVMGTAIDYPFGLFVPITGQVLNVRIYYSSKGGFKYIWSTGDSASTIKIAPSQSGTYQILVSDRGECTNKDFISVEVKPTPDVYAGPDTILCPQQEYVLQAATSSNTSFEWRPGTGLSSPNVLNPTLTASQTASYVLLATSNANNCTGKDSVLINVSEISASAGPDKVLCQEEEYTIPAIANGYTSVVWTPSAGLSFITDSLQPVFNPKNAAPGVYTLTVSNERGCLVSSSVKLEVGDCPSYIKAAQAFTPNGDGNNDFFTVFAKYVQDYEIRIYNRWGELVYTSTNMADLNHLEKGWDGTYKGTLQNVGTYVYYISATDLDGKKLEAKGNLTLIR